MSPVCTKVYCSLRSQQRGLTVRTWTDAHLDGLTRFS